MLVVDLGKILSQGQSIRYLCQERQLRVAGVDDDRGHVQPVEYAREGYPALNPLAEIAANTEPHRGRRRRFPRTRARATVASSIRYLFDSICWLPAE